MDEKIDRYELKSQLGRGGMATVYHAYDPRFKRYVAVKVLPREFLHDETFHSRFEREAMTIANLEHLAIVPVHDFGEYEGQPYLVMRYMPGGSLLDRIKGGPMPLADIRRIVDQLAPALDKAHDQGVIHRDLKPGNILFDEDDNAYLSDFGIAKISEATAQLTGSGIVGTPAYMAPEIVDVKELTPAVDIYALGVILYQMLTGTQPFQAATPMGVLLAHINHPIPDIRAARPDLPEGMQVILARALAKDPADRYSCAADLAADLNRVVSGQGIESIPVLPSYEAPPLEPAAAPSEALTMDGVEMKPAPRPPAKRRATLPGWLVGGGIVVSILAIVLIALVLFVILVNPFNWDLAFAAGEGQAAEEQPPAEVAEQQPIQPAEQAPTQAPVEEQQPTPAPTMEGIAPGEIVLIEGGPFTRGVSDDEAQAAALACIEESDDDSICLPDYFDDAQPVAEITLNPFFMEVTEVTNEAFAKCVAAEVCTPPSNQQFYADPAFAQHPVVYVDWDQAVTYCGWWGKRLPTEAEWEKAARWDPATGRSLLYPWGDEFISGAANTEAAGLGGTSEVQDFAQDISPSGILGMGGNVSEWVSDWYSDSYDGLGTLNPTGPDTQPLAEPFRVARGGSFQALSPFARAGHRYDLPPDTATGWLGFRCVQNAVVVDQPTPTATPESAENPAINLAFAGVETNSDWLPYIQEFDGVEMALVPVGCFMMGKDGDTSRLPIHEQCLDQPFWIDVYEVTNAQFREFGGKAESDSYSTAANLPREQISWAEAAAFCELRGARLPNEVEWEYAARGPDGLLYPWGNAFDCSRGNFDDETTMMDTDTVPGGPNCDGVIITAEVGSFPDGVSWVGAFDMSGNVSEWTSAWYAPYPYDPLDGREAKNNPGGYEYRVLRGGSWAHNNTYEVDTTVRYSTAPTIPSVFDGLRCVRSWGD